ncbi:hypothetical protein [Salinispora sp. H7-4]|uniref:hypothetical protein n=1 Tax=Salinispora sp. H7-4 TaxID=2748321 RepID=UPI0015D15A1B|nr:hypothetical protein [Salinispora sp. H7-4]NYT95989.1 hypothetical protein [Salinispora sp. H7-4]
MSRIPIQDRDPDRQHPPAAPPPPIHVPQPVPPPGPTHQPLPDPAPTEATHESEPDHAPDLTQAPEPTHELEPDDEPEPELEPGHDPAEAAWAEYLAATRQLDEVRRGAATAAGEQARAVAAAREELATVRARLAGQEARLREAGVPPISLAPTPPELSAANRSMASGPTPVLTALRAAADRVESADAALAARGLVNLAGWPVVARNLLCYAPLALLMPLVQLILLAVAGPSTVSAAALVVGLVTPAAAFAAGWWWVGRLAAPDVGGQPDRTPRLGALVCLLPAVLASTVLLLALLG